MALFDETLVDASDTSDVQAGGQGFLNNMGAVTTGAVISGLGSIYNTFASGVNALGGDVEEISTYKKLQDIDLNWAEYYKNNESAIDIAGFVGTSLIPGSIAIKGLNAVRAGASANAFGRALGFAKTKQAAYLDAAISELATEGGTVFTTINRNKLAAMAWGAADQTLTAAAFETGVALTMKQSPLLADDSWWEVGKSAFVGAAFGGIIGGGIDSILLNKSFKNLVAGVDNKAMDYKYINTYKNMGLDTGDEAYSIASSLLALPKEVAEMAGFVKIPEFIASRSSNKFVDMSRVFEGTLKQAEKTALLDFETQLRKLAPSPDVAGPVAEHILGVFSSMKSQGAPSQYIREKMGDLLYELKSVRAATDEPLVAASDLWYFKKGLTEADIAGIKTLDDWEHAVKASSPFDNNAYKKPYVFTGTTEQRVAAFSDVARIGKEGDNGFPTLGKAWESGKHVAILPDGSFRVNDASSLWKRVDDPVYAANRYLNTRTGALTEDTVLTAADRLPVGKVLESKVDAVYLDGKKLDMKTFNAAGNTEYFTARHAWASKLADKDIPTNIDISDFSLMDRLRNLKDFEQLDTIAITHNGEKLFTAAEQSIPDTIKSAKLSEAQRLLAEAYEAGTTVDTRALAYRLNVDAVWLENAVATRFAESMAGTLDIGSKVIDPMAGLSLPLDSYLRRENVIAQFARPQQFRELDTITDTMTWRDKRTAIMDQVAGNGGQFVTGELAWAYRVQTAIKATKNASAAVLGTERSAQLLDLAQDAAKLADSTGVGSSFLASSNASYGETLKLWSQNTGKNVHLWIQEDTNAVMDALNTHVLKMRATPSEAAELGIITNILRGTDEKYVFNPANPKQLLARDLAKFASDPAKLQEEIRAANSAGKKPIIDINADSVVDFLKTHNELNGDRIGKRTVLYNARGMQSNLDAAVVYAPPIDTTYFQHFAFVRPIEGKAFSTSEVSMVFGRDAAELSKRIAAVDRQNFDVVTKDQTERFFKAKGDYEFDKTINEPRINSELRRTGALSNAFPEVRPENLMEDYIRWHQNQAGRLVRDAVETNYAQQVEELRKLGESYVDVATSKFAGTLRSGKSEIANPYDDYVKTALDISKRSEYQFFHQANEFVDALGTRAYRALDSAFGDAKKGIVSWTEANAIAEKHGIKGLYSSEADFFTANAPRDRNLIREYVSKANMLLANFVLRFDFANSALNILSTPLMLGTELASIKTLASRDSVLAGKLAELTSVGVPGTGGAMAMPSTSKLIFNAVKNFFGEEKDTLITRYKANGDIKDVLSQYHSMLDDLAMRADFKVFKESTERAFDKAATLTGNNWSEQFTRFVSADVMRQLSDPLVEAGKLSLKEQNAYISTFVNRVQGNYISSQRPIVFQGVLGSAIGLFQTFSFNLLQQLLRHVENGDKRAVGTLFGMQAGLFGLNGTPMFEAVNTHIIGNAAINDGHFDAYSVIPQLAGKEIGDWLLYGTASAFPAFGNKWPALYSRGDINPRHISILPLNPVDVPAIDASIRVVKNIADVGSKLMSGADISTTLLQGVEHNGINRPLAGFAQVLAGQATTSKGSLISASSDFDLVATASRVLGAKPMDESVALNNLYRLKAYQASDRDRMEFLGEKVKGSLYKNQFPDDESMDGFMKDYAAAGGRLENFNGTMQRWMKDANTSTVEKMRSKLQSSYGQRLSEIMGGEPLSDYTNATAADSGLVPQ